MNGFLNGLGMGLLFLIGIVCVIGLIYLANLIKDKIDSMHEDLQTVIIASIFITFMFMVTLVLGIIFKKEQSLMVSGCFFVFDIVCSIAFVYTKNKIKKEQIQSK